jgi:hypothetical protein
MYVVGCKGVQYFKSQPTFRSNILPPSSWSRNRQSNKLACRVLIPVDSAESLLLTIWMEFQQFVDCVLGSIVLSRPPYLLRNARAVSNLQWSTDQQSISFLHKAT